MATPITPQEGHALNKRAEKSIDPLNNPSRVNLVAKRVSEVPDNVRRRTDFPTREERPGEQRLPGLSR
jgi:hypothetical protein